LVDFDSELLGWLEFGHVSFISTPEELDLGSRAYISMDSHRLLIRSLLTLLGLRLIHCCCPWLREGLGARRSS